MDLHVATQSQFFPERAGYSLGSRATPRKGTQLRMPGKMVLSKQVLCFIVVIFYFITVALWQGKCFSFDQCYVRWYWCWQPRNYAILDTNVRRHGMKCSLIQCQSQKRCRNVSMNMKLALLTFVFQTKDVWGEFPNIHSILIIEFTQKFRFLVHTLSKDILCLICFLKVF